MASIEEIRLIGIVLYRAVFNGNMAIAFERYRHSGDLILVFRNNLGSWPWELLCDPNDAAFIAMRRSRGIIRALDIINPAVSELDFDDLKILHFWSSPNDYEQLDIRPLLHAKANIANATARLLRNELAKRSEYASIHYNGHGFFEVEKNQGYLVLEDETGFGRLLTADTLANYLSGTSIKMIVLAACETATEGNHRFAGLAQHLLRSCRNVSVVVAYRVPIADDAANAFNEAYYAALARSASVKDAVTEARWAIQDASDLYAALSVVLFMR